MKHKYLIPVLAVGLIWLAIVSMDWAMRFKHFRWQDRLIRKASSMETQARGPDAPMQQRTVEAFSGGDLTRIAAVDEINRMVEEEKPATLVVTDEYGYRNVPPTDDKNYPLMVVGDSFLFVQYGEGGSFAHMLEKNSGQPVYNHSYPGAGAFWGLHRYLIEQRFARRPPKTIIWGLLERELGGELFAGYVYHIKRLENGEAEAAPMAGSGFAWDQMQPSVLRGSLPDTSFFSAITRRLWNRAQYPVFGTTTRDVVMSGPDAGGKPFLFYRYNLDSLAWTREQRNPAQIAWAVEVVRDYLRKQGSELLILLIPDKEQVYRELIPDGATLPPPALHDVEQELTNRNIPVVNLLPAFLDAKNAGVMLYWRDDTHWRPEAMAIAAEMVGGKL